MIGLVLLSSNVSARPKIGLALGGGGAKGAVHIGVLKVLERERIPVDYIAGTSIGSLVGGLYALGYSASDIEKMMLSQDWEEGYSDTIPREDLPYRLKQRDQFNVPLDIGLRDYQITSPSGLLYGQRAAMLLRETFGMVPTFDSFDDLATPFRAVATDLSSSTEVVLDKGDLFLAIRASSNVPGILAPVSFDGRLLVDGGMVNNVPVDVVKKMGADIVIAIDIGDELASVDKLNDTFEIMSQLSSFLTVASTEKQKKNLTENDILIKPDISNLSTTDWSTFKQGIETGYRSATDVVQTFNQYALSEQDYSIYLDRRSTQKFPYDEGKGVAVESIVIKNDSNTHAALIEDNLDLEMGALLTPSSLNQAVSNVYSLDEFQRVDARLYHDGETYDLRIHTEGKDWGPDFLEFGLGWETNFTDRSNTDLDLAYTATNLSQYGGEWRTQIELGSDPELNSELYWPLSSTRTFYASTGYSFESIDWRLLGVNALPLSVEQNSHQIRAGMGVNISRNSALEAGVIAVTGSLDNSFLLSDEVDYDAYGSYLFLGFDNLNSASFPTDGNRLSLSLTHRKEHVKNVFLENGDATQFGARSTQLSFEWKGAVSIDSHAFVAKTALHKIYMKEGTYSVNNTSLGGFLNMSGFNERDLTGPHKAFAALIYQYDLRGGFFERTGFPFYLGISAEAGNVWNQDEKIDSDDLIYGGSLYLGTDTIMGPIALGYGANDSGASSIYFYLGYEL